ncbi:MAG: beta-galactosidase, partial [Pseudomonadota bacterium]
MKLGVCYYPEHWPTERWAADAAHMAELGIRVVRIGEFAWSQLEPEAGDYRFDWLEQALDTLHAAGLSVVLGTPTACPPKWLVDLHPEILPVDSNGRRKGFGSRRHYDFSSLVYRDHCRRIVTRLADAFGEHPALVAWQIDNEYGCHDTIESFSDAAVLAFRAWCRSAYNNIDELNRAWGNDFWSLNFPDFDSIEAPAGTVTDTNPAHRLAWWRFSSAQVVSFNREQVDLLRSRSPGRDLMHNYMGNFTAFDHHAVARDLDVAGWDNYPLGFLDRDAANEADRLRWMRTGHPDDSAFHHDLYRGLGHAANGRLWLVEQQPGPVNWAPHNAVPLPGMVRLWGLEAAAHGAELCSLFRYRQQPRAQEQFHAGILLSDGSESPVVEELRALRDDLARLGELDATERAPAALVFDYHGHAALDCAPQGANADALGAVKCWYRALRANGVSVDILPTDADFTGYRLVLLANSAIVDADLVARLDASG